MNNIQDINYADLDVADLKEVFKNVSKALTNKTKRSKKIKEIPPKNIKKLCDLWKRANVPGDSIEIPVTITVPFYYSADSGVISELYLESDVASEAEDSVIFTKEYLELEKEIEDAHNKLTSELEKLSKKYDIPKIELERVIEESI